MSALNRRDKVTEGDVKLIVILFLGPGQDLREDSTSYVDFSLSKCSSAPNTSSHFSGQKQTEGSYSGCEDVIVCVLEGEEN